MSRLYSCRCLICRMEIELSRDLESSTAIARFRGSFEDSTPLCAFRTPAECVSSLHSRSTNGSAPKDSVLFALILEAARGCPVARDTLLLAFVPTIHSVSWQAVRLYPSLAADDIRQHTVLEFLKLLGSLEFSRRSSYIAFALSRSLRRNTLAWSARQFSFKTSATSEPNESLIFESSEKIERAAELRHFLYRCHERGILTTEDLDLLIRFKLDDTSFEYSNARRQRMKRLMRKLCAASGNGEMSTDMP